MKPREFRHRLATFTLSHKWLVLGVMALITAFFGAGVVRLDVRTVFSDLFPRTHPFVQVYRDHQNFGSPLTVTLMIKRVDGKDIFQLDTMDKIWRLSRDIDLAPGVDHDQILSIATSKARYTVVTPDGIFSNPIMDDHPPKTAQELAEVRRRVNESPGARTFLVSADGTATLINATFIERLVDYGKLFDYVQALVKKDRDAEHEIYVAGFPTMTGWIYAFGSRTAQIFAITLILMYGVLALHMRNVSGIVTPIAVSTVSAIWGFGLVGWLHQPVEPLLMVVPLLLVARCFSHCVQATERYYELLHEGGDKRKAAELSLVSLVWPGTLGIFCDVCGPLQRGMHALLEKLSLLSHGKAARYTAAVFVVLTLGSLWMMSRIQVGNPVEGSNLLREDSEFNTAVRQINRHFPGLMTMEVVFEGKAGRIIRQSDTLQAMQGLQHCLESGPTPPTATLSFADYAVEANRVFNGGNPKW